MKLAYKLHYTYINILFFMFMFYVYVFGCVKRAKAILEVFCACYEPPPVGLICTALDIEYNEAWSIINNDLSEILFTSGPSQILVPYQRTMRPYLIDCNRIGEEFWVDAGLGHNAICSLYLRFCSNKSIAVEHTWQHYLRTYGPSHLRKSTRGLRKFTANIRKIDETCGIKGILPYQLGYIVGLQGELSLFVSLALCHQFCYLYPLQLYLP